MIASKAMNKLWKQLIQESLGPSSRNYIGIIPKNCLNRRERNLVMEDKGGMTEMKLLKLV